jgi:hypothetical protein
MAYQADTSKAERLKLLADALSGLCFYVRWGGRQIDDAGRRSYEAVELGYHIAYLMEIWNRVGTGNASARRVARRLADLIDDLPPPVDGRVEMRAATIAAFADAGRAALEASDRIENDAAMPPRTGLCLN